MANPLINKVAQSSLITIDLEKYYPQKEWRDFDLKNFLFQGLILKEKDFRQALKQIDWYEYKDKVLLLHCSADAIIPVWAYMLVAQYASGIADWIFFGAKEEYIKFHYYQYLSSQDYSKYRDAKIVIKGCGEKEVPPAAYAYITEKLRPYAQSIMYGEPCSTVPIYKKTKSR